jgi:hypothetical protein
MDNGDGSELPMNTRASELDSRLARTHRERRVTRILLLGAGESGKSTVLKQMRLIHGMTFTDQERAHYTAIIWSDTVQSMRIILEQAEQLGVSLGPTTLGSEIASYRNLVMSTTPDTIYMEDEDNDREFMKEYVVDMHHTGTHNVDPDENDELLGMSDILCFHVILVCLVLSFPRVESTGRGDKFTTENLFLLLYHIYG